MTKHNILVLIFIIVLGTIICASVILAHNEQQEALNKVCQSAGYNKATDNNAGRLIFDGKIFLTECDNKNMIKTQASLICKEYDKFFNCKTREMTYNLIKEENIIYGYNGEPI